MKTTKPFSMRLLLVTVIALVMAGCTSNFYITRDDFIKQVANNQSKTQGTVFVPAAPLFFVTRYDANNIRKVLCRDKEGNTLYLFPDHNTQLEITTKSTGDVVKMYFNTVFLEGDRLVGLRSRILPGMKREIILSDIERIEIYAEFPRTEKADLN